MGWVAVCVFAIAMNRLFKKMFLRPCGFFFFSLFTGSADEGCAPLVSHLSFSFPPFLHLPPSVSQPQQNRLRKQAETSKKKKRKEKKNSRPESRLSHKKTKHPFNLSSYYIAIFFFSSLPGFDLTTMARIRLRLGRFQTPPLCNT